MSNVNEENKNERKNRKTKSISFDLSDEYEKGLLEHAEKINKGKFSRYIKRLIADDKDKNMSTGKSDEISEDILHVSTNSPIENAKNNSNVDDTDAMKNFL